MSELTPDKKLFLTILALIVIIGGSVTAMGASPRANEISTALTNMQSINFNNPSSITNCNLSLINDLICSQLVAGVDTFLINAKSNLKIQVNTLPALTIASSGITSFKNILVSADNAFSIGTATNRFANMIANNFNVYAASGDTNPSAQLTNGQLNLGVGGSSPFNMNLVNWFNGATYFRTTANSVATFIAVLDTSGTQVPIAATASAIAVYGNINLGENFELLAQHGNGYLFNVVAGTGALYPIFFQMGGTTVYKLSTTGVANSQGFQSIIATALTNGAGATTISLPITLPDTTYSVTCTTNTNLGAIWVTAKATNQFVLNTANNAGATSTADCNVVHQ